MKTKAITIPIISSALIAGAQAANLISYDFESDTVGVQADGASISNSGTSGSNGTVGGSAGGVVTVVNGAGPGGGTTNYLSIRPADDASEGTAAPHVATGGTIDGLGNGLGGDDDYTFVAWVRFTNQTGDNMVYGGNAGDVIHLGSRGNDYWSGHWGDDTNSADSPATEAGVWHHVAWTNTAGTNEQSIYVDGVLSISGAAGPTGGYTANGIEELLVGTSRNGGSFNGDLDELGVYDEVLSAGQIGALAGVIPEPSGSLLLALSGLMLTLRRRR